MVDSVYLCIMKKELGKWFMDIAKYLATAILLSSMFSDLSDKYLFFWAFGTALACLVIGLYFVGQYEKIETKKKNKKKRR